MRREPLSLACGFLLLRSVTRTHPSVSSSNATHCRRRGARVRTRTRTRTRLGLGLGARGSGLGARGSGRGARGLGLGARGLGSLARRGDHLRDLELPPSRRREKSAVKMVFVW